MTDGDRPFSVQVERSIAERAAGGDSSAVAELYDAYERQLYGYCQRICRNPEDAADATQDAFCSVIQRLPGLDTANLNFAAYLFTTARNACMDIIKQRGRAEPTDEVPEDPFATAALDTDPERQLLTGDQQRAAREASDRLPESQRTVLALREVSELSYDEIAETMGMKPNAVAQLISRARLNFYKQLRTGAIVISPLDDAAQRAIELTVQRQDGKINSDDLDWLQAHLKENEASRVNAEAIQESAVLYRAIAPAVVIAGLREETLTRAIDGLGANAGSGAGAGAGAGPGGAAGAGATAGGVVGARPEPAASKNQPIAEADDKRRDQRRAAEAVGALIVILLLALALDNSEVSTAASATQTTAPTAETTAAKSGDQPRSNSKSQPRSSGGSIKPPGSTQNSQGGGDLPVKSGGSSKPSPKNGSNQKKTSAGTESETPAASDPAPQTTTPPASEPTPDPNPTPPPPPPKKPPLGPLDLCSSNCNQPPPVP